jgi:hypothetical protein
MIIFIKPEKSDFTCSITDPPNKPQPVYHDRVSFKGNELSYPEITG